MTIDRYDLKVFWDPESPEKGVTTSETCTIECGDGSDRRRQRQSGYKREVQSQIST